MATITSVMEITLAAEREPRTFDVPRPTPSATASTNSMVFILRRTDDFYEENEMARISPRSLEGRFHFPEGVSEKSSDRRRVIYDE